MAPVHLVPPYACETQKQKKRNVHHVGVSAILNLMPFTAAYCGPSSDPASMPLGRDGTDRTDILEAGGRTCHDDRWVHAHDGNDIEPSGLGAEACEPAV